MGEFDPVSWDTSVAALGPPAAEITALVEQLQGEVRGKDPYVAVKTLHDALYEDSVERSVPSLGAPFITLYLLEKHDIITPKDDTGTEYHSIVARRPPNERLRELFWEQKQTLWWIGILTGVHPSLVSFWLYETDIPLMERNYTAESIEKIRAYQESTDK